MIEQRVPVDQEPAVRSRAGFHGAPEGRAHPIALEREGLHEGALGRRPQILLEPGPELVRVDQYLGLHGCTLTA